MARGNHNSPQKTDFSKRKKSQLKAAKLIKKNDLVLKKLVNG